MKNNHTYQSESSLNDIQRDMPEVESHNLDKKFEAEMFQMTMEEYERYQERAAAKSSAMGKDFERYLNDEGEDVRDLAERAEALGEARWERQMEAWYEKHQMDKDL